MASYCAAVPKRPQSHVVGSRATTAVVDLFERRGHAVERILNDYGEDLLVQTAHVNRMDACRLWIQVKGTEDIARHRVRGGFRIDVPFGQAMRWLRTLDTVIVVLWDVQAEEGWFAYPEQHIDEQRTVGQKTVTLRFSDDDRLDEGAVDALVWQARIDHYDKLFAEAQQNFEIDRDITGGDDSPATLAFLGLDLLSTLGLASSPVAGQYQIADGVRAEFWERLDECLGSDYVAEMPRDLDVLDQETSEAVIMTVVATFGASAVERPWFRLPVNVLYVCTDLLVALLGFTGTPEKS